MTNQITLNIQSNLLGRLLRSKLLRISNFFKSDGDGGRKIKKRLEEFKLLTKRHVLLIKHVEDGLFSPAHIDRGTLAQVTKAIQKFNGKPFDLILHTPGGDPFSSLFISRIIKKYPKQVRAIVPMYAMSGGTILALSTSQICMGETACLGPVDPQLGSFLSFGSANNWDRILKFKGKKTKDESISMAYTGKQYTKSIRDYIDKTLGFGLTKKQKKIFIDFITSGKVEHAFPLTTEDMEKFGFKIDKIPKKQMELLTKIITYNYGGGVSGV